MYDTYISIYRSLLFLIVCLIYMYILLKSNTCTTFS